MNCFSKHKINQVKQKLEESKNILILSHINPDGDAIGGSLGMYLLLKKLKYQVHFIIPNGIPDFLNWLPGFQDIHIFYKEKEISRSIIQEADFIFNIDFNAKDRLGDIEELIVPAKAFKVLIDHHPNPEDFCDVVFSDTSVSSAAELVFQFMVEMDFGMVLDKDIAECLLAGIMADTGSFSHNASLPGTYETVAKLLNLGADKDKINARIYANFSADRMHLLGYALHEKMRVFEEAGSAYISLTKEELKKFNFNIGDTEGFVNYPLSIKGIHFATLILEKSDHIKFSFRSRGTFPVNSIARKYFNGGGHKNASAGRLSINITEAERLVEKLIFENKDRINKSWDM